ncbi:hypothetical protein C0989_004026 [Termitomyces sp. Mn162]|nr:hypothetical protein C0989_004026 [Termitomyces sp. Mn162]
MFALKQKHPVAFIAEGMDEEDSDIAIIISYDHSTADTSNPLILEQTLPLDTHVIDTTPTYVNIPFPAQFVANEPPKRRGVQVKKKYKPVASHISKDFQIEHQIIGNPLATIPQLNPNPPPFIPMKQFTSEQQAKLVKDHTTRFLTTGKINVLVNMVAKQEKAFAWEDSEQGNSVWHSLLSNLANGMDQLCAYFSR